MTLSITTQVSKILKHMSPRRKRQALILGVLMIVASFVEVISIGAVIPFLGVLTEPERIFSHSLLQYWVWYLHIESPNDLLLPLTILFIIAAIFAGLTRIILLNIQTRLSMAIGADFSIQVYERTLYQSYSQHLSRNSSEILAGSEKAANLANFIIQPILNIISSIVIILAITIALLTIQPYLALGIFFGFAIIYIVVTKITKQRIKKNSQIIAHQQVKVTKAIQEGLGGIRDVLIDGTQPLYTSLYRNAYIPMQLARASNYIVGTSPRFGIEALGMAIIASFACILASTRTGAGGVLDAIPVLGALVLGSQRLLPLLQQIYNAYITIKGNQVSTQDALELLAQQMPASLHPEQTKPLLFQSAINLKDVGFRYSLKSPWVLRHINLEILKGSRIGFVGMTGSGKSTLLDLIMGLLSPTEGTILIDNLPINPPSIRAWQAHISHVPQTIYLADTSIAENIAFGVRTEDIDMQRVKDSAQQAQIADTIESWQSSYETIVGERGMRLSGGQRQRIGIARALYKRSDVIIFDEATSALDNETELAVMRTIESLGRNVTLLIIAHRLTTLKNCDQIVKLEDLKKM